MTLIMSFPLSVQEVASFWRFSPSQEGALCPDWWVLRLGENKWGVLLHRKEGRNLCSFPLSPFSFPSIPFPFFIFCLSLPLPLGCLAVTCKPLFFSPPSAVPFPHLHFLSGIPNFHPSIYTPIQSPPEFLDPFVSFLSAFLDTIIDVADKTSRWLGWSVNTSICIEF